MTYLNFFTCVLILLGIFLFFTWWVFTTDFVKERYKTFWNFVLHIPEFIVKD